MTMTSDKLREQLIDQAAESDYVDMVMLYMEGVEDQLESDNFLPGLDVTWDATCELLIDIARAAKHSKT